MCKDAISPMALERQGKDDLFATVKLRCSVDSLISEKADLKLNIQKTKIMASGSITSWQIDGETVETVTDYFGGL